MEPDWKLLAEAYLLPFRRWREVLTCFWPAMAAYVVVQLVDAAVDTQWNLEAVVPATILSLLLFFACAVRW